MSELDEVRHYYAEELRAVANLQSEAVIKAFAKVPREHFLSPGPWQVFVPGSQSDWTTKDADPRHLYHNLLVVIDAERHLNNGHPSFLAFLIDQLELRSGERVVHVGCGPGYYTAVMAKVIGSEGRVIAIEIDTELAARARTNLSYLSNVEVVEEDGGKIDPGPSDAILVNAGATHPCPVWLDSLRPGGRLLLPLTAADEEGGTTGGVLKVRREQTGFAASFISRVAIFPCAGARDPEMNERLKKALKRKDSTSVQSLRRDTHEPADTCWLHAENFCLSKLNII
jgi:protein-L-isoaspartate(D-aspartate) O-methyltransferase